jgi:hypothetical protein
LEVAKKAHVKTTLTVGEKSWTLIDGNIITGGA